MKRTLLLILYLFGGLLLGTLLTEVAKKVSWLSWLCWGESVGIDSFSVDLAVIQFDIGVHISMNIALLLCIIAAVILYVKTSGKIH
ncbi:MAG TPA: DUF4321 domain-containing protein [Candidatus Merdivicinus faecavium]|nr:DUF4321 domain-containing protein [Candidatus Merdivicinus faecavium]